MKKTLALMLSVLLLFGTVLPAFALTPAALQQTENGYTFTVTADDNGDRLTILRYYQEENTVYIPKTLGGVEVTAEDISAALFAGCEAQSFTADNDNAYFSVSNGVLFTKDGKTLIAYPGGKEDENYVVPAGVTEIGAKVTFPCSSLTVNSADCVIAPNKQFEADVILCGEKGSAAEKTAEENGYPFILLGAGHTHTYINVIKSAPNCINDGEMISYCPCDPAATKTTVVPATGVHNFIFTSPLARYICIVCGAEKNLLPIVIDDDDGEDITYIDEDDCTCVCHADEKLDTSSFSSILNCVLYRIKLLFWRFSHSHPICECGRRHY